MNKHHLRNAAKCMACTLSLSALSPAWAGTIDIQLPQKGDAVGGANIACVAKFQSAGQPITRVDFLVDGQRLVPKAYKNPVEQARVTFVWDATGVAPGDHILSVRAYAGDVIVGEDQVGVVVSDNGESGGDVVRPQIHLFSPGPNSVVSGIQDVSIHANDNTGVAMVSLFIDKQLKLLQNVPPFRYSWDTTQYANGPHTLEVWAFDAAQNKGEATPVRVFVNNGTGRTEVKDLPDEVPTSGKAESVSKPKAKAAPVKSVPAKAPILPAASPKAAPAPVKATARVIAPKPLPSTFKATAPAVAAPTKAASRPQPKPILPAKKATDLPLPKPVVVTEKPARATVKPVVAAVTTPSPKPVTTLTKPAPAVKSSVPAKPVRMAKANPVADVHKILSPKPPALKPSSPLSARTVVTKKEFPTLIARLPVEAPTAVIPPLRASRPVVPAAAKPAAVSHRVIPAVASAAKLAPVSTVKPVAAPPRSPVRTAPAAKMTVPASVASPRVAPKAAPKPAPVRMARAETGSSVLGHARAEDPTPSSPASARTLLARPPLRLMMGQDLINFDVQPIIEQGVAIAPLRQIIEHTGGVVMWLPADRTVQATTGSRQIEVKIGSRRAWINHEVTLMDRPAILKSGRTMVPVRFLQAALDMKAVYDPSKGLVYLYRQ